MNDTTEERIKKIYRLLLMQDSQIKNVSIRIQRLFELLRSAKAFTLDESEEQIDEEIDEALMKEHKANKGLASLTDCEKILGDDDEETEIILIPKAEEEEEDSSEEEKPNILMKKLPFYC